LPIHTVLLQNSDNELALLQRLKQGDEDAFTLLYHKYSLPMYINFLRLVKDETLAEEFVQEIFTRIWMKRKSISIEQDFAGYIYRCAQNMVYDFYRKLKRNRAMYLRFKDIATHSYTHIEEALTLKESKALLDKVLNRLTSQQRNVYLLCKIHGQTYKQAGSALGISAETVKEHLARANAAIRHYVANNMDTALGLMIIMACK
jgi:RNA polymerase sigma factor, sigma-70 family